MNFCMSFDLNSSKKLIVAFVLACVIFPLIAESVFAMVTDL